MRILCSSLALFAVASGTALAQTIHVPGQAPNIASAVLISMPGDVIEVADGVYTGPGNRDVVLPAWDIVIRSAGGAGRCTIAVQGSPVDPHRAFIVNQGQTRATRIEGFTITGGDTLPGAIADTFNGGGILTQGSSPTIQDCNFIGNSCGCWGGAVSSSQGGSPLIDRCYFEGNSAGDEGGALFAWDLASPVVKNSVFIGNSANSGGGAISVFSSMRGEHLTVVGNDAPWGSGVLLGTVSLKNSIIWGNTGGQQVAEWNAVLSFCDVEGGFPGVGNFSAAPLFEVDGYHLLPSSPCIDVAGLSANVTTVDIDGQLRNTGRADVGADEVQ